MNMAFHAQNKLPNSSIYNLQSIANSLNFNLNVSDIGSPPTKESAVKLENATKLSYDNISREHIINSSKLGLLKRVLGDYKAPKYIFFIRNPCLRKGGYLATVSRSNVGDMRISQNKSASAINATTDYWEMKYTPYLCVMTISFNH